MEPQPKITDEETSLNKNTPDNPKVVITDRLNEKALNELEENLREFSGNLCNTSSLSKILVNCLENGDDLYSADIVGLSYVLAEQLDTLKERIAEIRTNVYGI